jgi:hypothetical protein
MVGDQAIIVAGEAPLKADVAALKRWPHVPRINELLKTTGLDHPYAAFGDLVLDSDGIDRFVRDVAIETHTPHADLVSVDDRPLLEYSTPRGNLLEGALARNTERLMRYATASALDHLAGDVREEDERLLLSYAARRRGYRHLAKWLVEPVAQHFVGGIHDPLLRDLSAVAEGDPWP